MFNFINAMKPKNAWLAKYFYITPAISFMNQFDYQDTDGYWCYICFLKYIFSFRIFSVKETRYNFSLTDLHLLPFFSLKYYPNNCGTSLFFSFLFFYFEFKIKE
jgi:hypothetical protein